MIPFRKRNRVDTFFVPKRTYTTFCGLHLIICCQITICCVVKNGRHYARLEIVYTPKGYRGFESLLLRHKRTSFLIETAFLLFLQKTVDFQRLQDSYKIIIPLRMQIPRRDVFIFMFFRPFFTEESFAYQGIVHIWRGIVHLTRISYG